MACSSRGGQFKSLPQAAIQKIPATLQLDMTGKKNCDALTPIGLDCKWYGQEWANWLYKRDELDPLPPALKTFGWMLCEKCKGVIRCEDLVSNNTVKIVGYVEKVFMDGWENA